jgi:hypothetical protein
MTTEVARAYHKVYRRRMRHNFNTARQPRRIKIIDERCADAYYISKTDYEMYKAVYQHMKGIQVVLE